MWSHKTSQGSGPPLSPMVLTTPPDGREFLSSSFTFRLWSSQAIPCLACSSSLHSPCGVLGASHPLLTYPGCLWSRPGVEPGLSRPQRVVLTTRRCGQFEHLVVDFIIACSIYTMKLCDTHVTIGGQALTGTHRCTRCSLLTAPGVEPGLSRPQRDVLTTRRWVNLNIWLWISSSHAPYTL